METESLIRYACVTEPFLDSEKIAFPYLQAIDGTGLGARVMPLGMIQFGEEPWTELSHLFLTALRMRFINVVCVPPGTPLRRKGATDGVSALVGLLTVGVPNVAICAGLGEYSEKEVAVLRLYNRVICPNVTRAQFLASQGVDAIVIPPDPEKLSLLFSGIAPL